MPTIPTAAVGVSNAQTRLEFRKETWRNQPRRFVGQQLEKELQKTSVRTSTTRTLSSRGEAAGQPMEGVPNRRGGGIGGFYTKLFRTHMSSELEISNVNTYWARVRGPENSIESNKNGKLQGNFYMY